jgi:hypothetical protein
MAAGERWHYIAQRFDGTSGGLGDFIDFDVPLQGVSIDDVLSGHNGLSGSISPEYVRLKGPDGMPVLEEGACAIWAEDPSGEIRGGGLLTHSAFDDESGTWKIECTDLTGTSEGLPFDSAVWFVNVDPADLFRYIWTHIQSHPNHNLGISIDPTTTPIRLGTDLIQREEFDTEPDVTDDLDPQPVPVAPPRYATNTLWREAAVKAMKASGWKTDVVDAALKKWLQKDELIEAKKWEPLTEKERTIRDRSIDKVGWPPDPPSPGTKQVLVVNMRPQVNPPEGGEEVEEAGPTDTNPGVTYQADAYKLNWYESLDLGEEINNLAASTPFDWHLTHRWVDNEIRHHIRLGYPRIGRRREELRFVVGENIAKAPEVERDGIAYANEVVFLGAGEGASMIRARAFRRDDKRIRKVVVVSDPSVTDENVARQRAETELAKRFNIDNITEVVVSNHPHAPIGSVDLGDEILVQGDLGWVDIETWCRVVGRTMSPDDSDNQSLTLLRSDRIA